MLVREVLRAGTAAALLPELLSVLRAAVLGAAIGLLLSRAIWPPVAPRATAPSAPIEVPSLCENSRGVWQRCPWVRERNPARVEPRPTVSRWERR